MIITRKLIKFGGSKVITLPKQLIKNFGKSDKIKFDIKIVENIYKCAYCGHVSLEENYCPSCGESIIKTQQPMKSINNNKLEAL